tara:strand:- start:443 stop:1132 length:690 start_codon:yes stop_codon:yes gene_type:complete
MRATDFINIYCEQDNSVEEGVNDPYIFKAVFLAGGPGSGKSFINNKLMKQFGGMRTINSDNAFEALMKKANLSLKMPDDEIEPRDAVRGRSKEIANKQDELARDGRLGMIIDGTGAKFDQISNINLRLLELGYETAMVFVNTDLETALARNAKRDRTVPPEIATDSWQSVQKNIGRFQQVFGNDMFIIDNSDDSDVMQRIQEVEKTMRKFLSSPPSKKQALDWIQTQRP